MTIKLVGGAETAAQSAAAIVHDTAEVVAKAKADAAADVIKTAIVVGALVWLATGGKLPKWLKL